MRNGNAFIFPSRSIGQSGYQHPLLKHLIQILCLFKSQQKVKKLRYFGSPIVAIIFSLNILLIPIKSWAMLSKDRSKCTDCYRSLWIDPNIHPFLIHIHIHIHRPSNLEKSTSCAFYKFFQGAFVIAPNLDFDFRLCCLEITFRFCVFASFDDTWVKAVHSAMCGLLTFWEDFWLRGLGGVL